jgi:AraC-like DNA-binding protein
LLETTDRSVKEIRAEIGVEDESHFFRDFKRAYGLTPAQYRARHRALSSDH